MSESSLLNQDDFIHGLQGGFLLLLSSPVVIIRAVNLFMIKFFFFRPLKCQDEPAPCGLPGAGRWGHAIQWWWDGWWIGCQYWRWRRGAARSSSAPSRTSSLWWDPPLLSWRNSFYTVTLMFDSYAMSDYIYAIVMRGTSFSEMAWKVKANDRPYHHLPEFQKKVFLWINKSKYSVRFSVKLFSWSYFEGFTLHSGRTFFGLFLW